MNCTCRLTRVAQIVVFALAVSCGDDDSEGGTDGGTDTDTDSSTSGDTDADGDSDTDTDTDTDTDSDFAVKRIMVMPHFRETDGTVDDTSEATDTLIHAAYIGDKSAVVDIYLYDDKGAPLEATGGSIVCEPCSFELTPTQPKNSIRIDDLIEKAAGFAQNSLEGQALIEIKGDADNAALMATIETARTGPEDRLISGATIVDLDYSPMAAGDRLLVQSGFDSQGDPTDSPGNTDGLLHFVNIGGQGSVLGASDAVAELRLYDFYGQLIQGSSGPLCDPCTFDLDGTTPSLSVNVGQLYSDQGGTPMWLDFVGVVDISGPGAANVIVSGEQIIGTTHPGVLSYMPIPVTPLPPPIGDQPIVFIEPDMVDGPYGSIGEKSVLVLTNFSGLAGIPSGDVNVVYFVFDGLTGGPLMSTDAVPVEVCNPCTSSLNSDYNTDFFSIYNIAMMNGAYLDNPVSAFTAVSIQGSTANNVTRRQERSSHSDASASVTSGTPSPPAKTYVFPHILEVSGNIANTQNTFDTAIVMAYAGGLLDDNPGQGATVDLYIFDETTGAPLVSDTSQEVCNPCSFPMGEGGSQSDSPRKRKIVVDDLIEENGGFPSQVFTGFAVIVVDGDSDNVNLTSAVVNARTGPDDLSVFVFDPQPITADAR